MPSLLSCKDLTITLALQPINMRVGVSKNDQIMDAQLGNEKHATLVIQWGVRVTLIALIGY